MRDELVTTAVAKVETKTGKAGSAEPASRGRYFPFGFLRLAVAGKPWTDAAFLLTSLFAGIVWFVPVVVLLAASGILMITLIGLPLLALTLVVGDAGARAERWRVRVLLGQEIRTSHIALPEGTPGARFRVRVSDRAVWRDLAYLIVLLPLGVIEFVVAIVMVSITLLLMLTPIGLTAGVMAGMTRLHRRFAMSLLGTDREAELEQRVTELTESRSRVLDAVAEERRRIERDLHDGAQQRLVALAMDLGMAKQKLESDPADPTAAKALVDEAHDQAKRALTEMRDLVRGIHPAVLTDRGLDAAISALAARSPVPVSVEVDLKERLPEAVETNAYFVVAEALTNVAKHSRANQARVIVRPEGARLIVEVADDGVGGAAPEGGSGLAGLRDRVAALDGVLRVSSPPAGPTWVRAELPFR